MTWWHYHHWLNCLDILGVCVLTPSQNQINYESIGEQNHFKVQIHHTSDATTCKFPSWYGIKKDYFPYCEGNSCTETFTLSVWFNCWHYWIEQCWSIYSTILGQQLCLQCVNTDVADMFGVFKIYHVRVYVLCVCLQLLSFYIQFSVLSRPVYSYVTAGLYHFHLNNKKWCVHVRIYSLIFLTIPVIQVQLAGIESVYNVPCVNLIFTFCEVSACTCIAGISHCLQTNVHTSSLCRY